MKHLMSKNTNQCKEKLEKRKLMKKKKRNTMKSRERELNEMWKKTLLVFFSIQSSLIKMSCLVNGGEDGDRGDGIQF